MVASAGSSELCKVPETRVLKGPWSLVFIHETDSIDNKSWDERCIHPVKSELKVVDDSINNGVIFCPIFLIL